MLESLNEHNQYYTVTITPLIPRYTQLSKPAMTHTKHNERSDWHRGKEATVLG